MDKRGLDISGGWLGIFRFRSEEKFDEIGVVVLGRFGCLRLGSGEKVTELYMFGPKQERKVDLTSLGS